MTRAPDDGMRERLAAEIRPVLENLIAEEFKPLNTELERLRAQLAAAEKRAEEWHEKFQDEMERNAVQALRIADLETERDALISDNAKLMDAANHEANRSAALEEGLQGTLASMDAMEAAGDMSDENLADLWNAAADKARAPVEGRA